MTRILTVAGSLRAGSSNAAILRAAGAVAPAGVELVAYTELGALPPFNPDLDVDPAPAVVARWRAAIANADGVLISSPEYAHGIPGVLKNALDWLVSAPEVIGKPIALVNASPTGGEFAQPQLVEILRTMNTGILADGSLMLPFVRGRVDADGEIREAAVLAALRGCVDALLAAIRQLCGGFP